MQPPGIIRQPTYARVCTEMKHRSSWLSLIGSCVLMAVGAAVAFAIIVAAGSAALADRQNPDSEAPGQQQAISPASPGESYEGVVTDSHCGARHIRNSRLNPTECARLCVRQGARYVLVDGNRRYKLVGSQEALEKFAGQRIRVSGTRQGDTIQVSAADSLF
jgi:hypothetical protein